MPIPRSILALTGLCPGLLVAGAICYTIGESGDLQSLATVGAITVFSAGVLLLPLGCLCLWFSLKLSHQTQNQPSDRNDLKEFLLGSASFIMIILGTLMWLYVGVLAGGQR